MYIRPARPGDENAIFSLLHALADYEKLLDGFSITKAVIALDYLSEQRRIQCDLAFEGERPVGIATWYWIYGTFDAKRGIYLEDLFVPAQFRGKGYGKALLTHLAKTAVENGGGKVEWSVLPWNKPSIDLYEGLGATRMNDWLIYRLTGEALEDLADS